MKDSNKTKEQLISQTNSFFGDGRISDNPKQTTRRLTLQYMIALSTIALLIIVGYIFVQSLFSHQIDYAYIVNIAGRQRMFSQQLSKDVLITLIEDDIEHRDEHLSELSDSLSTWSTVHINLRTGDTVHILTEPNEEMTNLFTVIEPHYQAISDAVECILSLYNEINTDMFCDAELEDYISIVLAHENEYLEGMDAIVFELEIEAARDLQNLVQIEFIIMIITLLALALESVFIFRPAINRLQRTFVQLLTIQNDLSKTNESLQLQITQRQQAQEALQISENKYRNFVDDALVGVASTNLKGEILFANDALLHMLEYENFEELKDDGALAKYRNPKDRDVFLELLQKSGKVKNFEVELLAKSGRIVIILLNSNINRDILNLTVIDISELRQTQREIKRIYDLAPTMLGTADNDGYFKTLNPAWEKVLGYTQEELRAEPFINFVHPDDHDATLKAATALAEGIPVIDFENRYRAKDGTYKQVLWNTIFQDEKLYFSVQDITERKQAQEAQHKQRMLTEALGKATAAINSSLDFEEVLELILVHVEQVIPHDTSNIMLIEAGIARIVKTNGYTKRGIDVVELKAAIRFKVADVPNLHHIVETGQPFIVSDVREYSAWINSIYTDWVGSHVSLPIRLQEQIIGFLNLDSATPNFFTSEDIERLQTFADQVAATIQNTQLFQQIKDSAAELEKSNQTLLSERNMLQILIDNLPDFIFIKDNDGRFLISNIAHADASNLKPDDFIGKIAFDIYPEDLAQQFHDDDEKVLRLNEFLVNQERSIRDYEDNPRWVLTTKVPLHTHDGDIFGLVGISRDITERKKMEETLRKSEEKYRVLIENHPEFIIRWNPSNGKHTFVNESYRRHFNKTEEELLNTAVFNFALPGERESIENRVLTSVRALTPENSVVHGGSQGIAGDGEVHWYAWQDQALFDELGQIIEVQSIGRDITERKEAEEALRKSEEQYRTILENMQEGYYETDLAGNFVLGNRALWEMLDYSEAEFMGTNYGHYYAYPDSARDVYNIFNQVYKTGQAVHSYIGDVHRKDGSICSIETSIALIYDNTRQPIGFRGVTRDITERKEAEEALQVALKKEQELSLLKDRFMQMASHEFRTPISVIGTSTQILQRYFDKLSSQKRDNHIRRINQQVKHIDDMIENIMHVFRTGTDPLSFNPHWFDFEELCQDIIKNLGDSIGGEHHLIFSCEENLDNIFADAKLLRIVVSNLLSNAIKYSPQGTDICLDMAQQGDQRILQISDKGIGIPAEDLEHLFEAYHRGSNALNIKGIGLGLRIVKDFVERHQGSIEAQSIIDEGTTFTISLPTNQ